MKIYSVTYNDDNGSPSCDVFMSQAEADSAAKEWVEAYKVVYPQIDYDQEWEEVLEDLVEEAGFIDSITLQVHEISDSEIVASAKAQLGDLLDQVYQMQGMFPNDDALERAIADAEAWPDA